MARAPSGSLTGKAVGWTTDGGATPSPLPRREGRGQGEVRAVGSQFAPYRRGFSIRWGEKGQKGSVLTIDSERLTSGSALA